MRISQPFLNLHPTSYPTRHNDNSAAPRHYRRTRESPVIWSAKMRLPCTGRPAVLARLEPTFSRSQRPLGNAPYNVSRSGYFCLPLSIYFTGASHAASCTPYRRANSRHHYIDGSPQSRGSPGLGYFSGARTSLHGSQQTLLTLQRQSCKPSKLILYPVSPPTPFSPPFLFRHRRASHTALRI